jgi:hypothetical protein
VPLDTPVTGIKVGDTVWLAANASADIDSCSPATTAHVGTMYTNARTHASGSMLDPFNQNGTYANVRGMRFTMELASVHEWAAPATNPVYILIGQSNAAGQADDATLPDDFVGNNADVQIYALDTENWENLIHTGANKNNITPEDQSGFGGDRWGIEMVFGRMAADAFGDTVYIIKMAIGSTPLSALVNATNNWHPATSGGYYDELLGYITDAMAEIPESAHIAGIIWYQGESDCDTAPEAAEYEDNLGDLISALRTDLASYYDTTLPFLIFRIYDQDVNATRAPQGPTVRAAQLAVAEADADTYIASVDDLSIADTSTHLNARGYMTAAMRAFEILIEGGGGAAGYVQKAPFVLSGIPDVAAQVDEALSFTFGEAGWPSAVDDPAFAEWNLEDTLTYSAELGGGGALPAWLDFDGPIRTFSGTPASGVDEGTLDIRVTVSDGTASVSDDFTMTVGDFPSRAAVVFYTGTGVAQAITGVGFEPDIVIIKDRLNVESWTWVDKVLGVGATILETDTDEAATADAQAVTAFDADGFTVGTSTRTNNNGDSYIAICLKECTGGIGLFNYTGNGTPTDRAHGLGGLPLFITTKNRGTASTNWIIQAWDIVGDDQFMRWDEAVPHNDVTDNSFWNGVKVDETNLRVGTHAETNANAANYIGFALGNAVGQVKVGSYVGDGENVGPFVHCGFQPKLVMCKDTDASTHWFIWRAADPDAYLHISSTIAEATVADGLIVSAEGFHFENTAPAAMNVSGRQYLFAAFK